MFILLAERFQAFYLYYRKFVNSVPLVVSLAFVGFVLEIRYPNLTLFSIHCSTYCKLLPPSVLLLCFVLSSFIRRMKNFPIGGMINFRVITCKWYITNEKGDFYSCHKYIMRNNTGVPVKEIRNERCGFFKGVGNVDPVYEVVSGEKPTVFKLTAGPTFSNQQHVRIGGTDLSVHIAEWNVELIPHLSKNEELKFIRAYRTSGTEIAAFEEAGTYAGWRVFYPTGFLEMYLFAPPGYIVRLIDYHISDESGNEVEKEKKFNLAPKVVLGGNILVWRIYYPKLEHRYSIRYSLREERHGS